MNGEQNVIKVFLVNGESRSVRLDERMDVAVRGGEGRACVAVVGQPSGVAAGQPWLVSCWLGEEVWSHWFLLSRPPSPAL